MSIEHMAMVLHHSRAKGTRKLVLLGVANHEGDGGAYPTVATLARYANVDTRNVQHALAWLASVGELVIDHQGGGDRDCPDERRPNRYQVKVTCPAWCDRTTQHRDTRPKQSRLPLSTPPSTPVENRGDDSATRVTDAPPPRVTDAPPKPSSSTNPPTPPPDARPCQDCGQAQTRCQSQQRAWAPADRHPYAPTPTLHAVAGVPTVQARRRHG